MVPTGNSLAVVNEWSPKVEAYAKGPLKNAFQRVVMEVAVSGNTVAVPAMQELSNELDLWVAALPSYLAGSGNYAALARQHKAMKRAIEVTQQQRLDAATRALFNLTTVLNRTQDIR